MNGWYRIGIVLSVLFFISFGGWLWTYQVEEGRKSLEYGWHSCDLDREIAWERYAGKITDQDWLRDPKYLEYHHKLMQEESDCRDRASAAYASGWNEMWKTAVTIAAISVALLWLVALITVAVVRWIVNGFRVRAR
jgi:hypothetical protein